MSEPATSGTCPSCGAETPAGSRFCPQCGTALVRGPDDTAVAPGPPAEPAGVPVEVGTVEPHLFGVTPPLAAAVLGLVGIGVAIVLFGLGAPIAATVLLVVGVVLLLAAVGTAARLPDSPVGRIGLRVRDRAGTAAATLSARSGARRRLARLRAERERLAAERRARLEALGAAVYGADEAATEAERAGLDRLHEAIAAKEAEMEATVLELDEQVRDARLASQRTEMVEVPEPGPAYPPPGEADPAEPARIPEPYPPPDEATPPEPARIPEPEPDPGRRSE